MCRTAVSVWMATNFGKSSTPYSALAVSWTCQTTTAAISIGLPSASLTLATALSKFRIRTDTRRRSARRLTQCRPGSRSVPWYRPNSCTTRASPATTWVSPRYANKATASSSTPGAISDARFDPAPMAAVPNATAPRKHTTPISSITIPGSENASDSASGPAPGCRAGLTGTTCMLNATTSGLNNPPLLHSDISLRATVSEARGKVRSDAQGFPGQAGSRPRVHDRRSGAAFGKISNGGRAHPSVSTRSSIGFTPAVPFLSRHSRPPKYHSAARARP